MHPGGRSRRGTGPPAALEVDWFAGGERSALEARCLLVTRTRQTVGWRDTNSTLWNRTSPMFSEPITVHEETPRDKSVTADVCDSVVRCSCCWCIEERWCLEATV